MKFLFLDLEFASSNHNMKKICEFGYVLVDETFKIIEKLNLIINPNIEYSEWDQYVVEHILKRDMIVYNTSPKFTNFYELIKKLLYKSDYIFGFAVLNDITAINDELKRYDLEPLEFDFYDVQKLYNAATNNHQYDSLEKSLNHYNISTLNKLHDAENDAYNTMLVLKKIKEDLNSSLIDFINSCPDAKDKCYKYTTEKSEYLKENPELIKENNHILNNKFNKRRYSQLVDLVIPLKKGSEKFKNKKIYISKDYTDYNYIQTLNLIQLITDELGQYVKKFTDANIYVKNPTGNYDDDNKRIEEYHKKIGPHLKVIDFNELLETLEITIDDIKEIPTESFYFLKKDLEKYEEPEESISFFDLVRNHHHK